MDPQFGIEVHAEVRVQRGTAAHCACGGQLFEQHDLPEKPWVCGSCGRVYE